MPNIEISPASTFEAAIALVREHVAKHPMEPSELTDFITSVYRSLNQVARASAEPAHVAHVAGGDAAENTLAASDAEIEGEAAEIEGEAGAESGAGGGALAAETVVLGPPTTPAVAPKLSVTRDFIICLEDGTKHKMMKRYLMRKFGLTPQDYRDRWGLPKDYPVTAPGYSLTKRREAENVGLGSDENKRGVNLARGALRGQRRKSHGERAAA